MLFSCRHLLPVVLQMSVDSTGSDEMGGSAKSSSTAPKPAQRFRKGSVAEEIAAMDEMDFDLDDSRVRSTCARYNTPFMPPGVLHTGLFVYTFLTLPLVSQSSSSHNSKSTDGKPVVSEELAEGQSSHISRGLGGKKARRASVVAITADEEALLELQAEMAASELAPGSVCICTDLALLHAMKKEVTFYCCRRVAILPLNNTRL